MEVFPSKNEQTITIAIVAFMLGALIGLLGSTYITDKTTLVTAIATLAAAFLGAGAAYKLEDNKKKREYQEQCLKNGNSVLFALYERIKALRLVQKDSINPERDKPFRMISMMPLLAFSYPESDFDVESLLFLLGTKHKQLVLDLHTEKECFKEAFKLIRFRSELHFNHVQPAMEAGGIQEGGTYTKQQMVAVLGERVFAQLERATDGVIDNVDKTIVSSEQVKTRLINALKELFPDKTILNFEFQENNA